jgi:dipeptidyl-peptidase-4
MAPRIRAALTALAVAGAIVVPRAQSPALDRELRRIFQSNDYAAETFGPSMWLEGGRSYGVIERSSEGAARILVAYDTATGKREVLADAALLTPSGAAAPLAVASYAWSPDRRRALLFTNTKKVWRENTRGDYWLLDRDARSLRKLGGNASASSLMFAKLSPDGSSAAYVRDRNLYIEPLNGGTIRQLTSDESPTIVNGTSDWVSEEELGIRDAFRWSPDGRSIAFWQFDASGVEPFTLINDTDSLYPAVTRIPYPKAGTTNSAVRIGVVDAGGGAIRWMKTPGDPRNTYLTSLQWTDDSRALLIQQLNRLQNTNDLLVADGHTGEVRRAHGEHSSAWVETVGDLVSLDAGRAVTWTSERDGWRHLYRIALDGSSDQLLTKFEADVVDVVSVDVAGGWAYLIASPSSATERFLYRATLDGRGSVERVTPAGAHGTHAYRISPDGRWALHTFSSADVPPRVDLVSLPDHRVVRTLADNTSLATKAAPLLAPPIEFFTVDVGGGVVLDGSLLKPAAFDPSKRYPAIVYVYGEPASQTVVDRWRQQCALQPRARQRGLPGPEFRQPGHAGAERHGVAEGGLRHGRRPVVEGTGSGGAGVRGFASVRGQRSDRRMGLERRRLEHLERDVPLSRRVQSRRVGRAGSGSAPLRHHLPGTLHGPAAGERRGLSGRLAHQLRRRLEGQVADHPRIRRRQRALPGNRAAGEPARRTRQAVRSHGLPEPHARDFRRGGHQPARALADCALLPRSPATHPDGAWTMSQITIKVNGRSHSVDVEPATPLLYVLRNDLGLLGPRFGCGLGQCGACAVIINGVATRSCVTTISSVRAEVTTLEGLATEGRLHPLQQAWIDEQVPACGFCQNGQIMTAKALLDKNPHPTDAQIREGMARTLCRCMTYYRVQAAIKRVAGRNA